MKKLLVLDCRNFGDSVIGLGLVEALSQTVPGLRIDALTREQFASMWRNHPAVSRVECASFPMGTMKSFGFSQARNLLGTVASLRGEKYDAVVNTIGDIRENFLGFLINMRSNWGPAWEEGHPMLNSMRPVWSGLPVRRVPIARTAVNVYEANREIARALGAGAAATPRLYNSRKEPIGGRRIPGLAGLHVSASMPAKNWSDENWLELGRRLVEDGWRLRLYCSPAEAAGVAQTHEPLLSTGSAELVAAPLETFFENLSECSVLISPDSFALHAAYALNVPRIVINGANLMDVWAPPGTVVLQAGDHLPCYPCYNRAPCHGGQQAYICIRNVAVGRVQEAIGSLQSQGEIARAAHVS